MTHTKWLKDRAHYEDVYDEGTVEQCLFTENYQPEHKKPLSNAEKRTEKAYLTLMKDLDLYFMKGERYIAKKSTVDRWMERDRQRDIKTESTPVPTDVVCKFCNKPMELIDSHLHIGFEKNEEDCMKFWFGCKGCDILRTVFDNGKIKDHIPWKCPKCTRRLNVSKTRIKEKITTTNECPFCGYKKVEELDLTPTPAKKRPTEKDLKEFRINKDRFCLSDEEGSKYMSEKLNLDQLNTFMKEFKEKKNSNIKTLTLPQLEKALVEAVEKDGFVKFKFSKPSMIRGVVIEFSIQDTTSRGDYDSKKMLKKIIQQTTEGTNWSLTTSGIDYRLGILTGKLRGLEEGKDFFLDEKGDKIVL